MASITQLKKGIKASVIKNMGDTVDVTLSNGVEVHGIKALFKAGKEVIEDREVLQTYGSFEILVENFVDPENNPLDYLLLKGGTISLYEEGEVILNFNVNHAENPKLGTIIIKVFEDE